MKTYSDLILLPDFISRFEYLKLGGKVGSDTFGFDRYLNQLFYSSKEWRDLRNHIIVRDSGCDLGIESRPIMTRILIHHINPMTLRDINNRNPLLLDPENLITVSFETHNAIHYGSIDMLPVDYIARQPGDTKWW